MTKLQIFHSLQIQPIQNGSPRPIPAPRALLNTSTRRRSKVPVSCCASEGAPTAATSSPLKTPEPAADSPLAAIPPEKLKALRRLGLETKDVIKLGRLGIGSGALHQIRNRWRTSEVAKLYCTGKPAANMKLLVDSLERESGGVVVHRSGGSVFLYRGASYDASETAETAKSDEKKNIEAIER